MKAYKLKIYFFGMMVFICTSALGQTEGESVGESDTKTRSSLKGGFFIEPGLTHESSNSQINYRDLNTDGSVTGYGVSVRLGAHFLDSLFGGIDARYSRPDYSDTTLHISSTADQYNIGPIIGAQTPYLGIRVWGAFIPFAEVNPAESNGIKAKYTNGTGYRLGAGVRVSVVSLNLEYQRLAYGNIRVESAGNTGTNLDLGSARLENESYLLGLSFPMAF